RPHDLHKLSAIASAGEESELWRHALAVEDILLSWSELTPALVLNRPSDMEVNSSKPYQGSLIESFGFQIPDTLITTDPDRALEFWRKNEKGTNKSVRGIGRIVQ